MRPIERLVSKLSIKVQIGMQALIGVAGLLSLAAFLFYSDHTANEAAARASRAGWVHDRVAGFDKAMLLAKKAEKNFLAAGRVEEVDIHAAAMAEAARSLAPAASAAVLTNATERQAFEERAAVLRDAASGYADAFGSVVRLSQSVGTDENTGLQGKLRAAVHDAEARLDTFDDTKARMWALMLRRHEKDFLMRVAPAYRDAFETSFKAFTASLATSNADPATIQAVTQSMAAYRAAFLSLVPQRLELQAKVAAVSTVYAQLEPGLVAWEQQALGARDSAIEALARTRAQLRTASTWIVGGVLACMLTLAALLGTGLSRALRTIADAMTRLAHGDSRFELAAMDGSGEIGAMARTLGAFRATAEAAERLQAEAEAARDTAAADKRAALVTMADTIEQETTTALVSVEGMSQAMETTACALEVSAGRTLGSATAASTAAAKALSTAQTVASAAEQLTASIGEINRQVAHSATVSRNAVDVSRQVGQAIQGLATQATRIEAVAGLIATIASRTNLLALNATIEAARAGEAGRGFAVVASEVKSLAVQTASSTEDITRELAAIMTGTAGAVAAVQRIEGAIAEVDTVGSSIAAAVEQQSAATAEIARSVQETAVAAQTVSARVAEVTGEAAATGDHTQTVRTDSAALGTAMRALKLAVVRAVRTSTDEINRRSDDRLAVDLPCQVELGDGRGMAAQVVNISSGGILLSGVPRQFEGVFRMRLAGRTLSAVVVRWADTDTLHARFSLADRATAQTVLNSLRNGTAPSRSGQDGPVQAQAA